MCELFHSFHFRGGSYSYSYLDVIGVKCQLVRPLTSKPMMSLRNLAIKNLPSLRASFETCLFFFSYIAFLNL